MKLKLKINLYTSVMFILLLVIVNIAMYFTFSKTVLNNELERTSAETLKTVKNLKDANQDIQLSDLLRAYLPVNGMFKVVMPDNRSNLTITDPDLQKLKDYPTTYTEQELKEVIYIEKMPYAHVSIPIITDEGNVANLQLIESLAGTGHVLQTFKYVLIIITVLAMFPVVLSSQILSNIISKPISSMIQTMSEIQKSGKHKQIPLKKHSKDELYEMGVTFNSMINHLEQNFEKQEQFASNASHELKTPLTIIESYSDLLKRRGLDDPALFEESIEAIHSEAVRMRELTQQLLMLTKTDAKWNVKMEQIHADTFIEEVVKHFRSGFNCEIDLRIAEPLQVKADVQKLKQLLYVFIENACKYSEGAVEVGLYREVGRTVMYVLDDGIGIPKSDIDKVFERFYRVDKARARKTGGFGLGLAIAKQLADAMEINVSIESDEGQGTMVKMFFSE